MFIHLINFMQNLKHYLSNYVPRIRVVHQILMVILVMVSFIIIQGLSGLKIIDSMQEVSRRIYNESATGSEAVATVQKIIDKLRISYLATLKELQQNSIASIDLSSSLAKISSLKASYQTDIDFITREVEEVQSILDQPASVENYLKLDNHLSMIENALNRLDQAVRFTSSKTVIVGKEFSDESRLNTLIILLVSTVVASVLSLIISNSVSKPLTKIKTATQSLENGDLTKDFTPEGSVEIKAMVIALNNAIRGLRSLVFRINQQAEHLYIASQELSIVSNETGRSATEIAKAMDELARGTSEQAEQINATVRSVNELAELVDKVSLDTENIVAASQKVAGTAQLGQKLTWDVAHEINELYTYIKEVAAVIDDLNNASQEIGEISTIIGGIAEQTALLSLNAAIEAARAGKQGKGFAVVATETGKLADQSKNSAELIAKRVLEISNRISQAVQMIHRGINKAEAGKNLTAEATITFEDIFSALNNILVQIDQVAVSARQMTEKNKNVIGSITTIAAISEESTASSEEVSATTKEQSAAVEEVTALSDNLASIAAELKDSVAQFKIKA